MKRIKIKPNRAELTTIEIDKKMLNHLSIIYLKNYIDKMSRFEFYSLVIQSGSDVIQKLCQNCENAENKQ